MGSSNGAMIGQPLEPHTPVGSPAVSPAGSPLHDTEPTTEQILASVDKADKDIVNMDMVIKKVTTELAVSH